MLLLQVFPVWTCWARIRISTLHLNSTLQLFSQLWQLRTRELKFISGGNAKCNDVKWSISHTCPSIQNELFQNTPKAHHPWAEVTGFATAIAISALEEVLLRTSVWFPWTTWLLLLCPWVILMIWLVIQKEIFSGSTRIYSIWIKQRPKHLMLQCEFSSKSRYTLFGDSVLYCRRIWEIPSLKSHTTRLSSLPAAPGFLCISCAVLYISRQSWVTLQRLVKNPSLLGLMIAWDVCVSWSIPVPLNLHSEHWRNPRTTSFNTGKRHHSFYSQIFKSMI